MPARRFDPRIFLERVGDGRTIASFQPGGIIFRQGDSAEDVFYLQGGSVKESVTLDHGKEMTVGILEPGQFFGTSGLDGGSTRASSTRAMRPSTVTIISNAAMQRALESEPAFAQMFVAYLLHHNSQIEAEKINLLLNRSEKRLARLLLLLAHASEGPPQPISPMITQDILADMISTTRPRANMFMRKFQRLGFIDYAAGGIRVNPSLLTAVLNDKV